MSTPGVPPSVRANPRKVRIEWGDCDPARIVYFPRYFEIFNACTSVAFEAVGLPTPLMLRRFGIISTPLVDVSAKFIIPCWFGEDVIGSIVNSGDERERAAFLDERRQVAFS